MSRLTFTLDTDSVDAIGDRVAGKVQVILMDEYRQLRLDHAQLHADHANIINKLDASGRLLTGLASDITAIKSDLRGINSTLTTLVNQSEGDAHDLSDLPAKVLQAVTDATNTVLDTFKATEADRLKIADLTAKVGQIDKPAK